PRTSSGKTQRRACSGAFLAGTLEAFDQWRADDPSAGSLTRAGVFARPADERRELLESFFRDQFARRLGLDPAAVDPHNPVSAFGLDSLTTVELKNALEGSLGVALPVSRFLEGASMAELAAQVLRELSAPAASSRGVDELLHEIRRLSDDQVKELLQTH